MVAIYPHCHSLSYCLSYIKATHTLVTRDEKKKGSKKTKYCTSGHIYPVLDTKVFSYCNYYLLVVVLFKSSCFWSPQWFENKVKPLHTPQPQSLPLLTPPLCKVGWFAKTQKLFFLRQTNHRRVLDTDHIFLKPNIINLPFDQRSLVNRVALFPRFDRIG